MAFYFLMLEEIPTASHAAGQLIYAFPGIYLSYSFQTIYMEKTAGQRLSAFRRFPAKHLKNKAFAPHGQRTARK
jgi:hypothetical protein